MRGLIDWEDEEHVRRTKSLLDFLGELQRRMEPRPPNTSSNRAHIGATNGVSPSGPGTAGARHPFEEEK